MILINENINTPQNPQDIQPVQIVGAYEVLSKTGEKASDGHAIYNCKCIYCGYETQMLLSRARDIGDRCVHYKQVGDIKIPYNKYFVPWKSDNLRSIFANMVDRCYNSECKDYRYYGKNGVTICEEWLKAPWDFEAWSVSHGYKIGLTIDRINGKKGYAPDNCQWVPRSYNARYTTKNRTLTANVTLSLPQWSELLGEKSDFVTNLVKNRGADYATEYIEEKLLDKKVLIQRQDTIKKRIERQMIADEKKRQKEKQKKQNQKKKSKK